MNEVGYKSRPRPSLDVYTKDQEKYALQQLCVCASSGGRRLTFDDEVVRPAGGAQQRPAGKGTVRGSFSSLKNAMMMI